MCSEAAKKKKKKKKERKGPKTILVSFLHRDGQNEASGLLQHLRDILFFIFCRLLPWHLHNLLNALEHQSHWVISFPFPRAINTPQMCVHTPTGTAYITSFKSKASPNRMMQYVFSWALISLFKVLWLALPGLDWSGFNANYQKTRYSHLFY